MSKYSWISFTALLVFLHAAYSAWLTRVSTHLAGQPQIPSIIGSIVPIEISIQAILAVLVMIIATIMSAPELKEITWGSEITVNKIAGDTSRNPYRKMNNPKFRSSAVLK